MPLREPREKQQQEDRGSLARTNTGPTPSTPSTDCSSQSPVSKCIVRRCKRHFSHDSATTSADSTNGSTLTSLSSGHSSSATLVHSEASLTEEPHAMEESATSATVHASGPGKALAPVAAQLQQQLKARHPELTNEMLAMLAFALAVSQVVLLLKLKGV